VSAARTAGRGADEKGSTATFRVRAATRSHAAPLDPSSPFTRSVRRKAGTEAAGMTGGEELLAGHAPTSFATNDERGGYEL
jgi:hypothetical protein